MELFSNQMKLFSNGIKQSTPLWVHLELSQISSQNYVLTNAIGNVSHTRKRIGIPKKIKENFGIQNWTNLDFIISTLY